MQKKEKKLTTPVLTFNFLRYFNKLKLNTKTYLEIGAGDSTIYFSKRFKHVTSFENTSVWLDKINKKKLKNVDLISFNKNNFNNLLKKELDKKPDYVMIDSDPHYISRFDIAKFIHFNKKNNCTILLDNGTGNMQAFMFLRNNYYCMDFPGKNKWNEDTVTSIFFTEKNNQSLWVLL